MNYRFMLFCLFLPILLCAHNPIVQNATHIILPYITEEDIHTQQTRIESMMFRHKCIKACSITGITVASCLYAYKWIKDYIKEPSYIQSLTTDTMSAESQWSFIQWADSLISINTLFSFGYNILFLAGRYAVVAYMVQYAFHPDSLDWYINNHVPYENTLVLIEKYALLLKTSIETSSDAPEYYMHTLATLMQELLHHVVCISAYVHYQAREEQHDIQQHYTHMVIFLLKTMHDWTTKIRSLSFDTIEACDQCIHETRNIADILTREIKHAYVLSMTDLD